MRLGPQNVGRPATSNASPVRWNLPMSSTLRPGLLALAVLLAACHDGRGAPGPVAEARPEPRPAPIVAPQGPVRTLPHDACPATFAELEAQPGASVREGAPLTCVCPAAERDSGQEGVREGTAIRGTVWGSGTYTSDSDLCAAAVHAGVVDARRGGRVAAYGADGCLSYEGTSRHGITTQDWGEWGRSFHFAQRGAGTCVAMPDDLCPANASELVLDSRTPSTTTSPTTSPTLTCSCLPSRAGGTVWGHGRYTTDSSICGAARHAGALDESLKGQVTIRIEDGCDEYVGSIRNDVRTQPWGSYDHSFVVVGHGGSRCARLP